MTTLNEAVQLIEEGGESVLLQSCALSVAEIERLVAAVEASTKLLSLSLWDCSIDDAGAKALAVVGQQAGASERSYALLMALMSGPALPG